MSRLHRKVEVHILEQLLCKSRTYVSDCGCVSQLSYANHHVVRSRVLQDTDLWHDMINYQQTTQGKEWKSAAHDAHI
jgi:hypothetical protein